MLVRLDKHLAVRGEVGTKTHRGALMGRFGRSSMMALVAAPLLAACGGVSGTKMRGPDGHAVGKLTLCSNPPRRCVSQDRATVSAINSRQRVVTKQYVTNGYFGLLLPPGRYRLYAKTPSGAIARGSMLVKGHSTAHVDLVFDVTNSRLPPRRSG